MSVGVEPKHIYYRLETIEELRAYPAEGIRELSWERDLPMIQRFYRLWGDGDDIQAPSDDERHIGDPMALVVDGEIASFMIPFSFKDGETEIGAVATAPAMRHRGYCRRVISGAARAILERGLCATLTTRDKNLAMRAAAEAIGMRRVSKGD